MTYEKFLSTTNQVNTGGQTRRKIKAIRKSNGAEVEIEVRTNTIGITGGMSFYYWDNVPVSVTKNEDGTYIVDDSSRVELENSRKEAVMFTFIPYALIAVSVLVVIIAIVKRKK